MDGEHGLDRTGTRSVKWQNAGVEQDARRIPLGVADMDLPGFPALYAALRARLDHHALGYTRADPAARERVARWYARRHAAEIDPDWVVLLPFGPRTAVRVVLDAAAAGPAPRGPVLTASPEYGGFAVVARAAGRTVQEIPLGRAGGGYRLPVDEFAYRCRREPGAVVALSSPHNPTGRVWDDGELHALAEAAAAGDGLLLSDEVHCEILHPGRRHITAVRAAGKFARHTVVVHSVGKAFNVSGLADAFLLVPDAELRRRVVATLEGFGFFEGGRLLGALAQEVALEHGEPWLRSLTSGLTERRDLIVTRLADAVPGLVACVPEASFLLWLRGAAFDGAPPGDDAERAEGAPGIRERLLAACGVELTDGAAFGAAGEGYARLNFALPEPRLAEAADRLVRFAEEAKGIRPGGMWRM
ncbi:aminotransferase class I/II-fold pyridoxal phosphate-dependent enzyme [Streptomyces sp. H10-C2]|uniref:aminotransferase class I/II-fold pyridoxal phosphate-dependent enzyme n=1 Tax=unclassified Streptomyces TaxID=2593676 RepID=UPI0024BA74DC|nr:MULTISPECIES: aminotransferase class I/II-fold pyridoxal phosphate-dependent enzyme [unclassified Streptomyces]MDJ0343556.1 aminotransferase class I/II-fold pyridoxal phosphate-dependent enzyme [Streptomyces sp. PH10-H1]MDJ0368868.1 aminotransferase class I/II-fold pyridoxal phosphate-dependent enzyme [Streptomyces sp. H10-C2]